MKARWRLGSVTRGVSLTLFLAGVALTAISCGGDDTAPPTDPGGGEPDGGEPPPDPEPGTALVFRQISAGGSHTCGVGTDDRAYCWGANNVGQLGVGSGDPHWQPIAVAGDLRFLQVSAGLDHTCGVTTDFRAFCWGSNSAGQLGDGTENQCGLPERPACTDPPTINDRSVPTLVGGGLQLRQIDAATWHTCAITTDDRAYCWGDNWYGQLGDGTFADRLAPSPVTGDR
jgi:hypothetical protein